LYRRLVYPWAPDRFRDSMRGSTTRAVAPVDVFRELGALRAGLIEARSAIQVPGQAP
jgi:hypothetical protein